MAMSFLIWSNNVSLKYSDLNVMKLPVAAYLIFIESPPLDAEAASRGIL